ncbi:MAG: DUF3883 domain-containing protein [Chloroflexi bacterium]|nr:DUF3883 domain-containing protein [Chloroflexota bacterium]
MTDNKHENYEILNLIGYGLAKFDKDFVKLFGFKTKTAFYQHIVDLKIAETVEVVKNRQDLFDPFFDNLRRGWWQKGNTYIHRKILIDSLFGNYNVQQFVSMVQLYIANEFEIEERPLHPIVSPVMKSKFKQLQLTGQAAELHFMNNYEGIKIFSSGTLEDARLFGDGYDFQIQVSEKYYLAEIKGVRGLYGSVRLTENEFSKAGEFRDEYALVVVSNLDNLPKMTAIFDPVTSLTLSQKVITQSQTTYHSEVLAW